MSRQYMGADGTWIDETGDDEYMGAGGAQVNETVAAGGGGGSIISPLTHSMLLTNGPLVSGRLSA